MRCVLRVACGGQPSADVKSTLADKKGWIRRRENAMAGQAPYAFEFASAGCYKNLASMMLDFKIFVTGAHGRNGRLGGGGFLRQIGACLKSQGGAAAPPYLEKRVAPLNGPERVAPFT